MHLSWPTPGINHFSKELWLLLVRNGSRNQDLGARCPFATVKFLLLGPFSRQFWKKKMNAHTHKHIHVHICMYIYHIYFANIEFTPIPSSSPWDSSCLAPVHICISCLPYWELWLPLETVFWCTGQSQHCRSSEFPVFCPLSASNAFQSLWQSRTTSTYPKMLYKANTIPLGNHCSSDQISMHS